MFARLYIYSGRWFIQYSLAHKLVPCEKIMLRRQRTQLVETVYFCYSFISAPPPPRLPQQQKIKKNCIEEKQACCKHTQQCIAPLPPLPQRQILARNHCPHHRGRQITKSWGGGGLLAAKSTHQYPYHSLSQHTTIKRAASTRVKASQSTASL